MSNRSPAAGPALPPQPIAIAAVLLFSRDPDTLARFYREKMGLALEKISLDGVTPHWACDINHVYISIWPEESEYPGQQERRFGGMALYVRDVWRTFDRLKEEGVDIIFPPRRSPLGLIARLKDPDGNPVELYQPLQS